MTVRHAAPEDAEALAALAAATFPLACPPHITEEAIAAFVGSQLSAERFRGHLADPLRTVLVDEDSGELLGYAMLVHAEPSDAAIGESIRLRPTAELSKFYLRAGRHGSGAAAALMAATLEAARSRGAVGVCLGVNGENLRAQRFYAKHGFAGVGTRRFLVGGRWEDDLVLERSL